MAFGGSDRSWGSDIVTSGKLLVSVLRRGGPPFRAAAEGPNACLERGGGIHWVEASAGDLNIATREGSNVTLNLSSAPVAGAGSG